ncbi:HAD-IC family P-type ATPase [Candidatus Parcubacteria bacterium]|nr:HAD-IC family P-type ATPase [Candidatus Parcubacteria bacterium]
MEKEISYHGFSSEEIIRQLETNSEQGLSEEEVKSRHRQYGKNALPKEKPLSQLKILLEQVRSPLIYILIIAGLITLSLKDYTDTIVIFGAVFLNTIFGYVQEKKASEALRKLKQILKIKIIVFRSGKEKIIFQEELVPGDIILLRPGDKVPADARLINERNLKINEAALTGEWWTAEKTSKPLPEKTALADRDNMVYMGTVVEQGHGKAVVTTTGLQTEIGKVAQMLRDVKEEKTPYQKKLIRFSKKIGIIIVLICMGIFIEGMLTGGEFIEMFTIAIAVAVSVIPEGLPMAMTVILSLGMTRILKKKGLVRKLASAETLGSTSIILTDKTGTLTEAKMKVAGIFNAAKQIEIKDESYILAIKIATLCSEAFIENPEESLEKWVVQGRPTDKALLLAGIQAGLSKNKLEKEEPKIDEISFSPVYKYSAVLHKFSKNKNILYVLGAPEIILEKSKLSKSQREKLIKKEESLSNKGLRVLAVAYKKCAAENEIKPEDVDKLIFVGFIGLHDPIRKGAKKAIKVCRQAGLKTIIITGDHKLTAKSVAKELGIFVKEKNILEGNELKDLSDDELENKIKDIKIYARVEPKQKLRIVKAWQNKGEVVAMTGDGINDAPALKQADIGVALGTGTEVAKEASDLVLLTNDFAIIVSAIEEGRIIIDNIRKVITYLFSGGFTEIILIGISLFFGWPLPILAGQILWINIIEDGPLGICLAFEKKEKDVMKQKLQGHDIPLLTKEMKNLIFIIGFLNFLLLLALFFWLLKYSGYEISHIRSVIFAGLTIDSIFYVFSCKSLRRNLWHINPLSNKFLIGAWLFGIIMLLTALYLPPLQTLLKTVPLNLLDWTLLLGLGILNIILIEAVKWRFITKIKK